MRIDKFLWFVRIVKTRSLARLLAEAGHIRMNGRRIDRAHALVGAGDTLTLALGDRVQILRVDRLPYRRGPAAEARSCYTDLSPAIDAPPAQT